MTESQFALVAGLGGAVLGWVGARIAFLLERKATGANKKENVAHIRDVVDLSERMQKAGMSLDDARQFAALLHAPPSSQVQAVKNAISDMLVPASFESNFAMKAKASAAYEVSEAKLKQVLLELEIRLSERENEMLEAAQVAWSAYRTSLENRSLRQFEGGSHATLAMTITGLVETERRIEELRVEDEERAAIYADKKAEGIVGLSRPRGPFEDLHRACAPCLAGKAGMVGGKTRVLPAALSDLKRLTGFKAQIFRVFLRYSMVECNAWEAMSGNQTTETKLSGLSIPQVLSGAMRHHR